MRRILLALTLVTGCGAGGDQGNGAAPQAAVDTSRLTGLYEGEGARPSQICMIDRAAGDTGFGLVVWGANLHSCSGAGQAVREGNVLRLTMAGDQSCAIEARIEGTTVTMPETVPAGCAYYCGAQAKLGGGTFTKVGSTPADALKAVDLVGEPLCSGINPAP